MAGLDPYSRYIGPRRAGRERAQREGFGGLGGAFLLEELRRGDVGTMTGFGFPEILVAIVRGMRGTDARREG